MCYIDIAHTVMYSTHRAYSFEDVEDGLSDLEMREGAIGENTQPLLQREERGRKGRVNR